MEQPRFHRPDRTVQRGGDPCKRFIRIKPKKNNFALPTGKTLDGLEHELRALGKCGGGVRMGCGVTNAFDCSFLFIAAQARQEIHPARAPQG